MTKRIQDALRVDITSPAGSTINNKTGSWRTYKPQTDNKKCIGCSMCEKVCPEMAISMRKLKTGLKPKTNFDFCKGCGLCANECPVKAIKMNLELK